MEKMTYSSPKKFLEIGGVVFIVLGFLGLIGLTGPTPERSIFGSYWWFDVRESLGFLVLGIITLISAYASSMNVQAFLTTAIGWAGILVGLYGFFWSTRFFGVNLESPLDNLLAIGLGGWAMWSVYGEEYVLRSKCKRGDSEACNRLGYRLTR